MTAGRQRRSKELGFTVVEVTIVMAIAMVVMSSLLGLLASQSNAAARVETFVNDQESLRLTMVAMQRDLRSAHAIVEPPADVDRGAMVDVELYADPETPIVSRVRWRITSASQLVREVVAPDGSVTVTASLDGVVRPPAGLFEYFSAHAAAPLSVAESAGTIADCTVRIHIDLRAARTSGTSVVALASDVQLRNRLRGRSGC